MLENRKLKVLLVVVVSFSVILATFSFYFFQAFYSPNLLIDQESPYLLKITSGSDFVTVRETLTEEGVLNDVLTFSFVSKVLKYQENIKPGLYTIPPKSNNITIVRLLRSGNQTPVNITFNNVRLKEDLADRITLNLEMSPDEFLELLNDTLNIRKFGFEPETILAMFIPNTYEVWWNISPENLFDRMYREYNKFWNDGRLAKANQIGLTPHEVSTLASIVQAETQKVDERPKVAGVYLNRLGINMPLQADPTLVFAHGDFTMRRVLNVHKEIDSPYNTYKYKGLPPGPINLPEISALEAVLNPEEHQYLYFCAKDDFSGYHAFAKNLAEHMANARRYQAALNKAKIF